MYGGIDVGAQLTAVRLSASVLGDCTLSLAEDVANAVAACAASKRADGEFKQLTAIEALHSVFKKQDLATLAPEIRIVRDLVELVWRNVFTRYYWLKERNQDKA